MCYPVFGMMHIKEPLLLIDKSSLCGGSGFLTPNSRSVFCAGVSLNIHSFIPIIVFRYLQAADRLRALPDVHFKERQSSKTS